MTLFRGKEREHFFIFVLKVNFLDTRYDDHDDEMLLFGFRKLCLNSAVLVMFYNVTYGSFLIAERSSNSSRRRLAQGLFYQL